MTNSPQSCSAESAGLPFQKRVVNWLMECFSMDVCRDGAERNHRFLEESLELVQSLGCTVSEAHQLVDYVFGRPVGEPDQELGGVQVTLAALCFPHDLDMEAARERELARVWTKIDKIRAKQAAKPKHSPLPEHVPNVAQAVSVTDAMIDAAAREMWNDRDARMGGPWEGRSPDEVCVIQTRATARAALVAALASQPLPAATVEFDSLSGARKQAMENHASMLPQCSAGNAGEIDTRKLIASILSEFFPGKQWYRDLAALAIFERVISAQPQAAVTEALLDALQGLMVAYGATDGRNGNSGECWDKARKAVVLASSLSRPHDGGK